MRRRFLLSCLVMISIAAVAAAAKSSRVGAAQFSEWDPATLVNLNATVLDDGTHCPAAVNSAADDQHPFISKDGLSLFFASNRRGPDSEGHKGLGEYDLWVSQRDSLDDCWREPISLGPRINTPFRDFSPALTTDGHWLLFHSNRPGGCGGMDLYATHRRDKRDDFAWEPPINLDPYCTTLNGPADDAGPTFFEDDAAGILYLYFTRNNKPGDMDSFDIWVSTCAADLSACLRDHVWAPAEPVVQLSSPVRDTRTAIGRRDGLEMIIDTNRPGGVGKKDLWASTRATTSPFDPWSIPVDLAQINSASDDGGPALSWDGTELYFYSKRTDLPGHIPGLSPSGDKTQNSDLYVVKRVKLRAE